MKRCCRCDACRSERRALCAVTGKLPQLGLFIREGQKDVSLFGEPFFAWFREIKRKPTTPGSNFERLKRVGQGGVSRNFGFPVICWARFWTYLWRHGTLIVWETANCSVI